MKRINDTYILTRKEAGDLFVILSQSRLGKVTGKFQTLAKKYWEKFERELVTKQYPVKK